MYIGTKFAPPRVAPQGFCCALFCGNRNWNNLTFLEKLSGGKCGPFLKSKPTPT